MIRHSSSFLISLFLHIALFLLLLFMYHSIPHSLHIHKEHRRLIKLSNIIFEKNTPKVQTKKLITKKVVKKIKTIKKVKKIKQIYKYHHKVRITKKVHKVKKVYRLKHINKIVVNKKSIDNKKLIQNIEKKVDKQIILTKNIKQEFIDKYMLKIEQLLKDNLYYPRSARKRGIEGRVLVHFILHKDATVTNTSAISSNSAILSRAAIKTINELSGKFPKPSEQMTLDVPINYSLVR